MSFEISLVWQILFKIGTRKANVLPVPDFDCAIILLFGYLLKLIIEWYWIGVGLINPHFDKHCLKNGAILVC